MWSVVVVIVTPASDDRPHMDVTPEQMLVQAFVSQPTVERFNEVVLHRLARGYVVSLDAALLLPLKNGVRHQLGATVRNAAAGGRCSAKNTAKRCTDAPMAMTRPRNWSPSVPGFS